ncbi:hypothetical protein O0I10_009992 [Lichtheimia ornata]|uniref:Uncharacterized protein n=1 Tax=Lichtheimia ornata TaxID=688661 RepID=A0AAD7UVQ3_9FUNG|nr:uncharacterized protein O0I10_009992 [Lichtheimia ornata]KAJ8654297.1 hypothetical protein O0I10_009992 [Lichtheimia ornata]
MDNDDDSMVDNERIIGNELAYQADQSGLQALKINPIQSNFYADGLVSVISTHRHTLRHVQFTGMIRGEAPAISQDVPLDHVTTLELHHNEPDSGMDDFAWFINIAPNVQKLSLSYLHEDDSDVCRAMKNLEHLKELTYGPCSAAFVDFLDHHATLGEESSLRKLSITGNSADVVASLLPTLYRLSQLQDLNICFVEKVTMDDLSIEKLAQGCPNLERLSLSCDAGIPSPLIYKIRLFPNLTTLSINRCHASNESLFSLLTCKRLKTLKVTDAELPNDVKEMLDSLLVTVLHSNWYA